MHFVLLKNKIFCFRISKLNPQDGKQNKSGEIHESSSLNDLQEPRYVPKCMAIKPSIDYN